VNELGGLARREPHLLERYGGKEVERRFEQQLNLALRTLRFRTFPASSGQRRGDIICLTERRSAKRGPDAVLIEAKTSAKPYSLPPKDERALIEYAERIQQEPFFNAPLGLICVIGQEPGSNIAVRLRHIQNETQIPTRYCTVTIFANLLRLPAVGVTAIDILDALVSADPVVSVDVFSSVYSTAERKWNAQRFDFDTALE
jgi:hypothetical protein